MLHISLQAMIMRPKRESFLIMKPLGIVNAMVIEKNMALNWKMHFTQSFLLRGKSCLLSWLPRCKKLWRPIVLLAACIILFWNLFCTTGTEQYFTNTWLLKSGGHAIDYTSLQFPKKKLFSNLEIQRVF